MKSPLTRHPTLFLRKIRDRMGCAPRVVFVMPPADLVYTPLESAGMILRSWAKATGYNMEEYPTNRVFHKSFEETELLYWNARRYAQGDVRSDVKLTWEYSRGYAHVLNALRAEPSERETMGQKIAAHLQHWLRANPNPDGVNWSCAMEVAIRAVNWLFADAALSGRVSNIFGVTEWKYWLWNHAHVIWERLETRITPSNHYIADLLGLGLITKALNGNTDAICRWRRFTTAEMSSAIVAQTYPDGGVFEYSTRYHALVAEMALLYVAATEHKLSPLAQKRLMKMCQLLADAIGPDGDVVAIGDDDSGRIVPMDCVSKQGRGELLLDLAHRVFGWNIASKNRSVIYRDSGWWFCRKNDWFLAVVFNGNKNGLRSHMHQDGGSFSLCYGNHHLLADPGSYAYTFDPLARNRFRSAAYHNIVLIEGCMPRDMQRKGSKELFIMSKPRWRYRLMHMGDAEIMLRASIYENRRRRFIHTRQFLLESDGLTIEDRIYGNGQKKLQFFFHLHPDVYIELTENAVNMVCDGWLCRWTADTDNTKIQYELKASEYSNSYANIEPSKCLLATGLFTLPVSIRWRLLTRNMADKDARTIET